MALAKIAIGEWIAALRATIRAMRSEI